MDLQQPQNPIPEQPDKDTVSFAPADAVDKSVLLPSHKLSRIIFILFLIIILLGILFGVYIFFKNFSIDRVYRSLYTDKTTTTSPVPVVTSSTEPALTNGDSMSEIEADLNSTQLGDMESDTALIKQEIDQQY